MIRLLRKQITKTRILKHNFSTKENKSLDDKDDSIEKKTKSSKFNFKTKTIALPSQIPIFNVNPMQIVLSDTKMQYFNKYLVNNNFLSVIYPRQEISSLNSVNDEHFYSLGTYCKVDVTGTNTIRLKNMDKFEIKNLTIKSLQNEQSKILDDLNENLNEKYDDNEEIDFSTPINQKFQSFEDLRPDEILFTENKQLEIFNFDSINVETRVKIDNLIDQARKIATTRSANMNYVVNYNDIDKFLDYLGVMCLQTGLFTHEQIIPLYAEEDFEKRLDNSFKMVQKLLLFSNKIKDVGKIAERNIQMRRNKELSDEIFNVIKHIASSKEESPIDKLVGEFNQKDAPKDVITIFEENVQRLRELDKNNSEFNVIKNYLEWMAKLPFGLKSKENFDILRAQQILNEDHYGLDKVKERILEFLAVGKLKKSVKGKILCLQGPPGVGKTSFAHSIGRVLNRQVFRISLGGENDISVLKGHRRTYVSSRPGKIIQALKQTQTENLVLIIDEIDKTAQANVFGDPQSTLLEILDPEQNKNFVDNYLDFPVDLSNIFFICTANNLNTISQPLLDRMDIIQLSSYTNKEKYEIYKQFLLPKSIENTGLSNHQDLFEIKEEVIYDIINQYSREAGIRSLEKNINKILEKIAYKIIEKTEEIENSDEKQNINKIIVDKENLSDYLGHPVFDQDNIYNQLIPGVVKGLAFNNYGGSVLFIEANKASSKKSSGLQITGNLGDVMKESMDIAYSFTRRFLSKLNNKMLEKFKIHIHVPEGATPKDGPSAGIALTSSLISLATNKIISNVIGMTGEISLKGKVLKIGGLKEKVIAAKREGLKKVIIPKDNKEDAEDLSSDIKKGISFLYVDDYEDVYKILFKECNQQLIK